LDKRSLHIYSIIIIIIIIYVLIVSG